MLQTLVSDCTCSPGLWLTERFGKTTHRSPTRATDTWCSACAGNINHAAQCKHSNNNSTHVISPFSTSHTDPRLTFKSQTKPLVPAHTSLVSICPFHYTALGRSSPQRNPKKEGGVKAVSSTREGGGETPSLWPQAAKQGGHRTPQPDPRHMEGNGVTGGGILYQ